VLYYKQDLRRQIVLSTLPDKLTALEDVLFEAGVFSEEQRDEIKTKLLTLDKPIEKLLTDEKYATFDEIALAKDSINLGIKCIILADSTPDEEAIEKLSADFAFKNLVAPVRLEGNVLTIAMVDPLDVLLRDDIRLLTGCEIQSLLATEDDIQDALRIHYGRTADDVIREAKTPGGIAVATGIEEISDYYDALASSDPTVKEAIDQLIIDAVRQGSSDIHIEPFARHTQIRYRIDGVLERQPDPPRELQWALISRVKILANMDIAQKRFPQDGKISLNIKTLGNREIDIRVSTVPIQGQSESLVLRILDKKTISYGLEQLGLMEDNYAQFQKMIKNPHGIILATGPTGSGKTTTLYACLKDINQPGVKIITIEEPVEYDLAGVCQIDVNVDLGLTFEVGLRYILRQDPDIVLVGEIRDIEAGDMAIHTSLTGHLVFSTLHTNDAASAITRLVDMGIEPFLVASTLEGIIAQRLVRRVCQNCMQLYKPEKEVLIDLGLKEDVIENLPEDLKVPAAAGCKECRNIGYKGRTGIFEVIMMNEQLREMCVKGVTSTSIKRAARTYAGMRTLREDGWRKVVAGMTTIEEVMRLTAESDYEFGSVASEEA